MYLHTMYLSELCMATGEVLSITSGKNLVKQQASISG